MIIGFIGQRNSGKTLSMTIEAFKKYKQGYKIYSNYHLNFPYTPFTVDDLLAFAEAGMYFGNSIFLIDEIHIYFDSRCSGQKRNRIFSYFLNQSSKNDIDIYYTSQFSRQVEVRMRLNTEIVVESVCKGVLYKTKNSSPVIMENYRPKPNDYKWTAYITNIVTKFSDTGYDKVTKRVYRADRYYKLYDTRQVIKMEKDVFQLAKERDKRNILQKVEKVEKVSYKQIREEQRMNRKYHDDLVAKGEL
jgi:hypothetical protein